jgi:hypothetical protein
MQFFHAPKYSGLSSTSYLLKGPAAENEAWMPSQQCSGADKGDFATFQHGKNKEPSAISSNTGTEPTPFPRTSVQAPTASLSLPA